MRVFSYLRKENVDVNKPDLPFSMHFDETTTAQVKKQMDLTPCYWSPTHNEVIVTFYTSLFFGHAEADKVVSRMIEQFHEDNISVDKLVILVRDGPNVNKAIMTEIEQTIKDEHPEFEDLLILEAVFCMSYITVLVKNLKCMAKTSISYAWTFMPSSSTVQVQYFKYREDYHQLQANLDIETFQQHAEVRWLSNGPAIRRMLEQWDAICQFNQGP